MCDYIVFDYHNIHQSVWHVTKSSFVAIGIRVWSLIVIIGSEVVYVAVVAGFIQKVLQVGSAVIARVVVDLHTFQIRPCPLFFPHHSEKPFSFYSLRVNFEETSSKDSNGIGNSLKKRILLFIPLDMTL